MIGSTALGAIKFEKTIEGYLSLELGRSLALLEAILEAAREGLHVPVTEHKPTVTFGGALGVNWTKMQTCKV